MVIILTKMVEISGTITDKNCRNNYVKCLNLIWAIFKQQLMQMARGRNIVSLLGWN